MLCTHCHTPLPDGTQFCPACGSDPTDGGTGAAPRTGATQTDALLGQLRVRVEGRYHVEKVLGRGGMGVVFLANETSLARPVAIKVLPSELSHDEKFVQRFEHEARTAAQLDHPNIIPIYAVEGIGDLHFFVMKYVTGRALDEILEAGKMPAAHTQRILWESACALGHAHTRGIVHRDIKPANIMIDDAGRTMLTDFGISKALQSASQFTATGQVIGTPHYMSPEQAKGLEVDGRSDQYSLAVVGYRMLSGRLPFQDDSVHTIIYKHIFEEPPALRDLCPDAPEYVIAALNKALAKDPGDRFATMEEFATAVLPTHPVTATTSSGSLLATAGSSLDAATEITTSGAEPRHRRRGLALLATLIVLGGGAGGAYWYLSTTGQLDALLGRAADPGATLGGAPGEDSVAAATARDTAAADTGSVTPGEQQQATAPPPTEPRPTRPQTTPPRETQQRPAPPQVGWLTINATPFGTVWIDRVEIGDTPVVRHALQPGRHIVEVRREGYRTVVDTVTITAQNELRLSKTLIRGEP
ncbi:MAG: protein kinase [Gemmatimonadota bacterium]|nr:MAG: protein kinase [Gemmatimonadota bacterium]